MIRPPADFGAYMNWRRTTPQGRRWWIETASKNHVRYWCERCRGVVWLPKGAAAPEAMPCPHPCGGMLVKQAEQQFTLDEEDNRE